MAEQKRKVPKQIHGNQNYLNFIKKNHMAIRQQLNVLVGPKMCPVSRINSRANSNFDLGVINRQKEKEQKQVNTSRVIHDSLSKFQQKYSNYPQYSDLYSSEKVVAPQYDNNQNTIYDQVYQKNNQIAQQLINNRSKHAKHEAAKELLFHLNKNKSAEHKRLQFRSITIDRYTPEPVTELNFKFPIIEKKYSSTIEIDDENKSINREDLRQRLRTIQRRQRTKKRETETKRQRQSIDKEPEEENNQRQKIQSKFKMREELYGLLPSFKGPNPNLQLMKKSKHQASIKNKPKISRAGAPPLQQMLDQYLQKNVLVKCASISIPKADKEKETKAIINSSKTIVEPVPIEEKVISQNQNTMFSLRNIPSCQEKEVIQDALENIANSKENEVKAKHKKSVITELKYEGDLTIYDIKIRYYREFIFMVNLAHRIYDPLILKDPKTLKEDNKYRFYLGKGNNYLLVKSLLKRRFWWAIEDDPKKANFVWTQLKINYFYQYQKKACPTQRYHKLDKDLQSLQSPVSPRKRKKKQPESKVQQSKAIFKAPLPPNDLKIFTKKDKKDYDEFLQKVDKPEKMLNYANRLKLFGQNYFKPRAEDLFSQRVHNHLEYNYFIGNKKALFYNLKQFYDLQNKNVFEVIPLTFHIKHGTADPQFELFMRQFKKIAKQKISKKGVKNVWIVKPGELSNRGQGISVFDELYELNTILRKKQKHFNGSEKTYIVQKYIQKPLLYKGRKFDIRHYMMISRLHGVMRAYWFGQGYIRTSSQDYNIDDVGDQMIHLTNDAIQKYSQGYGKYEEGNKVSYSEFQRYMDSTQGEGKFSFSDMIYPKMKSIALDAVKATYLQLDPNNTEHNFEIFGLDFMIDSQYNVWLIEVNTNPCLELSSKLLQRVIPTMLEQTFRLTLDVIFPPPTHYPNSQKYLAPDSPLERLQFQLIFDQDRDGKQLEQLFANAKKVDMGEVDEEDQTYENDGKQIELDNDLD